MLSRNSLIFGLFLVVFVAIAVVVTLSRQKPVTDKYSNIQNFTDCANAGFPVMESYPRRCSLPNRKIFTEVVVKQECLVKTDCAAGYSCTNHICVQQK